MGAKEKILDESKRLEIFLTKNKSLYEAKREKYFEIQEKQRSRGFIEKALFTDGNEIQMEKKDLGKLKESMDLYSEHQSQKSASDRALKLIANLESEYEQACSKLAELQKNRDDAIQRKLEREKRKKEREIIEAEKQKLKRKKEEQRNAKAAAYENKIREEAERIKRLLHDQFAQSNLCPYCMGEFEIGSIHADHIYPVSKGGLSTKQNMVYVCSSCNSKKRDKTLRIFCRHQGFSYDEVCHRLETLGKDI